MVTYAAVTFHHISLWFHPLNSLLIPAVCVRSAAGTAASLPVLACAWQLAIHTMWRSMAAVTLSWATASMCWRGKPAVCSVSRQKMCPAGAPGSPVQSRSPSVWEIPSYICWEVGELMVWGSRGLLLGTKDRLCIREELLEVSFLVSVL